ncbi:hypothetical protein [Fimbriiglobus ruber]|uniref:Uncharacterized protein n=1 Tax=Fimbriiglobus ruber TaxID=1908690 RepID=A0A225DWK2_9BACT|nr:hypothetical protein [Fimbriiglobus ruber]OWK45393.1 hypothetical protein FRUB_01724 [Fimbriiglobus ruber]
MSTEIVAIPFAAVIPPELDADTRAVLEKLVTGKPLDAATTGRIHRDADQIRKDLVRKYGVLDIGVPAVRELRDA